MKRISALLLVAALTLTLFAGCGKSGSETGKDTSAESADSFLGSEKFTADDTTAMSDYMNYGRTAYSGSWVYGTSFDDNGATVLVKMKEDNTQKTILNTDDPLYINVIDGWVYFLGYSYSKGTYSIKKTRLSGDDDTTLVKPEDKSEIASMFIYDNTIYYTRINDEKKEGSLFSCGLDGKNVKTVLSGYICYPYIVNDKIMYQSDSDGESLHICNLDGTEDKALIKNHVYQYVICGNYIYYMSADESQFDSDGGHKDDFKGELRRCKLDGSEDKQFAGINDTYGFAILNNTLYYSDGNDSYRLYSYDLKTKEIDLISQSINAEFVTSLGTSEKMSYWNLDKDGYIEKIHICNFDGTNDSELFGSLY